MLKKIALVLGMIFLMIISLGSVYGVTEKADLKFGISRGSGSVSVVYMNEGVSITDSVGAGEKTVNVDKGTDVTLTATPKDDYLFSKWSTGQTINPLKITAISANTELKAEFDTLKLIISDLDVRITDAVDGKTRSDNDIKNGDSIGRDSKPGDKVQFDIEVKNTFSGKNSEDIEIKDIVVEAVIEGIDDEDDLDDESKEFDLNPGKDENVKFVFEIPLEADEDNYDVVITVEGTDDNGKNHKVEWTVSLEVDKERHDVRIFRSTLSPSQVVCQRKGIQYTVGVINTGEDDEDEIGLKVASEQLAVDFRDTFDLEEGTFDDDITYSRTFRFDVPDDIEPGVYTISIDIEYDNGREKASKTSDLVVDECTVKAAPTTTIVPAEPEEEIVEVILPTVTGGIFLPPAQPTTVQELTIEEPTVEEKGIFSNTAFVAVLIGAEVLVALAIIILIVTLARRRG